MPFVNAWIEVLQPVAAIAKAAGPTFVIFGDEKLACGLVSQVFCL